MAPSDQDLLNLTIETDCYKELDDMEHHKVDLAMQGKPASTPRSNIARVAFYLARRLHPVQTTPDPPPPSDPWDSGYPPMAYNASAKGNAKYNVRINCSRVGDNDWRDAHGLSYDDSGLCRGGRTEQHVDGLKSSDETDGREPWDAYAYGNTIVGPNRENYPAESYER